MPQGRALKELSPEEVTKNVYTMVDVLLHNIHVQLQHGHSLQVFVYCSKKCFESEPNCELGETFGPSNYFNENYRT